MIVIYSVLLLGVLGFGAGSFLAFAAKKFEVKEDPLVQEIIDLLPGVNCGACGFPGCEGFGKAVAKKEAKADACLPGKRQGVPEQVQALFQKYEKDAMD